MKVPHKNIKSFILLYFLRGAGEREGGERTRRKIVNGTNSSRDYRFATFPFFVRVIVRDEYLFSVICSGAVSVGIVAFRFGFDYYVYA